MTQPGINPYAEPVTQAGSAPNPSGTYIWGGPGRYSVADIPQSTDPDYRTGGSQELKSGGSSDGTALPDDIRIGRREPPENDPNDREYNQLRYSEFHKRHSVEEYTLDWNIKQEKIPAPIVPEWTQERMPIRPTADKAPAGYMFRRPWHIPRNVKDAVGEDAVAHFSLADHRRVFEIYGMKPQGGLGTNTYRADPRPWDETLYIPPQPVDVAPSSVGNRSYRL